MSLNCFQNLIEAQSHLNKIVTHLSTIDGEEKRKTQLNRLIENHQQRREEIEQEFKALKQKLSHLENQLTLKEKQLAQSQEALQNATTQQQADSAQKQIDQISPQVDQTQEDIFSLLEEEEKLEIEKKEISVFLTGALETQTQLHDEISRKIAFEQNEIKKYEERIANLTELCEREAVQFFQKACQKHRYQNPLTFLENKTCRYCRLGAESSLAQSLERGDFYQLCDGCGRLFTPHSALT